MTSLYGVFVDGSGLFRIALRAIAFFNWGIGCHGYGVFDMAVPIEHSHGLTEDGKTVAPQFEKGDDPGIASTAAWPFSNGGKSDGVAGVGQFAAHGWGWYSRFPPAVALLRSSGDCGEKVVVAEGLGHIVVHAHRQAAFAISFEGMRGHGHDLLVPASGPLVVANACGGLEAVHHGHLDVHQHHSERIEFESGQRFFPVVGHYDRMARLLQRPFGQQLVDRVVFNEQDVQRAHPCFAGFCGSDLGLRRGRAIHLPQCGLDGIEQFGG